MGNIIYLKGKSAERAAKLAAQVVNKHLELGESVTWFLSGGSAIKVAVLAAKMIDQATDRLTVSLVDERWGPVGHDNSNWEQLITAGFDIPGARMLPILKGGDLAKSATDFNQEAQALLKADYKFAVMGIGEDGHTAGVLPHSSVIGSSNLADSYKGPDYARITLTPAALVQLDEVLVYAIGENKHQALNDLDSEIKLADQPAQSLKKIKKVTIFNDYKGETV